MHRHLHKNKASKEEVLAGEWHGICAHDDIPYGLIHTVQTVFSGDLFADAAAPQFIGLMESPNGAVPIKSGDVIVGPNKNGKYWKLSKEEFDKNYHPRDYIEPEAPPSPKK